MCASRTNTKPATWGGSTFRWAILLRQGELKADIPVVMQCRSGGRSAAVVTALQEKFGMDNLYNLKGGAQAWADQVDHSMEVA